jgi:quercetin dioxygenase-like cupin family protein
MSPTVDLRSTYLYAEGADLVRVESSALWPRLMNGTPTSPEAERVARGEGWLVGVFTYDETWPTWEMHPLADEVVHVTAGDLEFVLDEAGSERRVRVGAGETLVVPRGAWHTAIVHAKGAAVHVTFGKGTEHRPVQGDRG